MTEFYCEKCKTYGLQYCRTYQPADFIEGDPASPIWLIGINPAMPPDWPDGRSTEELREGFAALAGRNSYFRDFRTVSPWLFEGLGLRNRVAHTDLVKCSSNEWPPAGVKGRDADAISSNCSQYLVEQLTRYQPQMLVCNGSKVCQYIVELLPPAIDRPAESTSYSARIGGREVVVVLSGFIGRIDNHSKRRLGREIEDHARRLGLMHG